MLSMTEPRPGLPHIATSAVCGSTTLGSMSMILTTNLHTRGVVIAPFNVDPKEQVSVDLTVGSMYQRSGDPDWLHIGDEIVIHPGSCVLVQTAEVIRMPNDIFGLLATKGSIGAKGIVTANTKLDPLFDGNLNIPVFNVSGRKVQIKAGQRFCSISFWEIESPIVGSSTRNAIKLQPREIGKARDFLERNAPHIITAAVSLIGAIVAALITVSYGSAQ
jgi:deoxycytidine triphosphate deaminase